MAPESLQKKSAQAATASMNSLSEVPPARL